MALEVANQSLIFNNSARLQWDSRGNWREVLNRHKIYDIKS